MWSGFLEVLKEGGAIEFVKKLINPVIKMRVGLTQYWEACASCLDNIGLVFRPYKILIEYIDLFGKKHQKTFGGRLKDDEEVEDYLEELDAKGEREVVAYRSPILNDAGDDFAGWIFYHPHAYDNMKGSWWAIKKRIRNKLIKKASKKNKMVGSSVRGGVAQLKSNNRFGYTDKKKVYHKNSVNGFDAYYWYTKWTNDPTDCEPDFSNVEFTYDKDGNLIGAKAIDANVVSPIQTTANGSLVELSNGQRVFVEGKIVKSGDFVNVNGVKYKVK
jgi:hypothetical protein